MAISKIMRGHITTLLGYRGITAGSTYTLADSVENYDLVLVEASGYDNYYTSIYLASELTSRPNMNHWVTPITSGYGVSFRLTSSTQIKIQGKDSDVTSIEVYGIRL